MTLKVKKFGTKQWSQSLHLSWELARIQIKVAEVYTKRQSMKERELLGHGMDTNSDRSGKRNCTKPCNDRS